jgi:5-methyltetrahydropteroyltriglutamate--homocysteine methyltransferase
MITANLGFPRIGSHRELKFAVERFWQGTWSEERLQALGAKLRRRHWRLQAKTGIQQIPSNDFSFYDHVLDTSVMVGAVPARFRKPAGSDLARYFSMARGTQSAHPMQMTKWFDTNYHYIVPEFEPSMDFCPNSQKPVQEFLEAQALGLTTRPVLLGPVSFVLLGRCRSSSTGLQDIVERLVPVYEEVLGDLYDAGAEWVQIDEPFLALDIHRFEQLLFSYAYDRLAAIEKSPKILLATYFSGLGSNLQLALDLSVPALHLDLVRDPGQLQPALEHIAEWQTLSLGVIDGRNIWRANLDHAVALVRTARDRIGPERIQIAPSCSLLHVPVDLDQESKLDSESRSWMAFAKQKLEEVVFVGRACTNESPEIANRLAANRRTLKSRRLSPRILNPALTDRALAVEESMLRRGSSFAKRWVRQSEALPLPTLPTTTIGSLPQTQRVRRARAAFRRRRLSKQAYDGFLRTEIERAIRFQEKAGLDVLAHGEFERGDMVEYFAGQLRGFLLTRHGWVQSYGSRCVKPPILFGDVVRTSPMSVRWSSYAQSLTGLPVKGIITGPLTMLQWSFVRDDLPHEQVCRQIALALRDEVLDLEAAGIRIIQVDEPALREGLPLRTSERREYLAWAVEAFRLATSGVRDSTQIHTHMCYSDFGDIIEAILQMDVDVLSIEAARSDMKLLEEMSSGQYRNCIGPGVYDVHSPRVPACPEYEAQIHRALEVFRPDQLWINPDCGLKTRSWQEIEPALRNMVIATRRIRAELSQHHRAPALKHGEAALAS